MQLLNKLQILPAQRPQHNTWMQIYPSSGELDEKASCINRGKTCMDLTPEKVNEKSYRIPAEYF